MPKNLTKDDGRKKKPNKKMIAKQGLKDTKDEKFSLDQEIVIGLNLVDEKNIKVMDKQKRIKNSKKQGKKQEKKQKQSKQKQVTKVKRTSSKPKKTSNYLEEEKRKQKAKKRIGKILKIFLIFAIFIGIILFAMLSPVFQISQVQVINNSKVSSDTILSLSRLEIGENLFRFSKKKVEEAIKENPYIEDVSISRSFPNQVKIEVKERVASFQIAYADSYVYLNNQGYLLEISPEKNEFPILEGYQTKEENIKEGNRICTEDLEKLEEVLKIVGAAKSYGLYEKITRINMEDKNNYQLILETEQKTIHLGTASDLNTKMPNIQMLLEQEAGVAGDYFLNIDLNKRNPYFRERV